MSVVRDADTGHRAARGDDDLSDLRTYITRSPEWRFTYIPTEGPSTGRPFTHDFNSETNALIYLAEIRRLLEKAGEFNEAERYITHKVEALP